MAEEPVRRRLVFREEILEEIRSAIFSGELKPGDRIIETTWAKRLGTSQGPVREAIRDLEAQGMVETVPFKGSRVRSLTGKDVRDNYSVRICLESKSIRDALTLLDDQQLAELVEKLTVILQQMDECAGAGDLRQFTESDAEFHRAIIDATGNRVLRRLWEQCNMRNWFMYSALTEIESLKKLQAEHQRLVAAIAERDLAKATLMLETHVTGMMEGFMKDDED